MAVSHGCTCLQHAAAALTSRRCKVCELTFACVQLPVGSTFKDPGCYAISTAPGNSNPVRIASQVIRGVSSSFCLLSCCIPVAYALDGPVPSACLNIDSAPWPYSEALSILLHSQRTWQPGKQHSLLHKLLYVLQLCVLAWVRDIDLGHETSLAARPKQATPASHFDGGSGSAKPCLLLSTEVRTLFPMSFSQPS